jgi:hypothetical protein
MVEARCDGAGGVRNKDDGLRDPPDVTIQRHEIIGHFAIMEACLVAVLVIKLRLVNDPYAGNVRKARYSVKP